MASVTEPSAAPSENPRYWKELLRERMIGASFSPAMPMRRACCGWKEKSQLAVLPPFTRMI
jgi:hypothetical protein